MSQARNRKRFRPHMTVFHHSTKILPELLEDVIRCYLRGGHVCKVCYYRRNLSCPITYEGGYKFCQECKKFCESVWLMPSSRLCENFGDFDEIPIPGMPSWAKRHLEKPLSICQKDDHYLCYERSANSDIWFAHTIEELVIWTIEREYDTTFRKYIEQHHPHMINSRRLTNVRPGGNEEWEEEEEEEEEVDKWRSTTSRKGGRGRGRVNYTRSLAVKNFSTLDLDEFPDLSTTGGLYDPEKVEIKFSSLKDIPPHLLEDIAKCYIQGLDVCKFCFFCRLMEVKKPLDWEGYKPICLICKSAWKSVKVIPASSLCSNFNGLKNVPISVPLIKPNKSQDKGHKYCSKTDHLKCYESKYDSGFSRAHSVEELVIWTVEKDSGVGYGNFLQYVKDNGLVSSFNDTSTNSNDDNNKSPKYAPDKCLYTSISSIPNDLLFSISKSYESRLTVCRTCFFESLSGRGYHSGPQPVVTLKAEGGKTNHTCERGHVWRGLRVIPSSPLCQSYADYIAIPPVPKHMQTSKSPFKVCSMADHRACFEKTRENNPWFPHAVEEMVIWTVERETGKDFQSYQTHIKELYEEQRLYLEQLRMSSPPRRQYNGPSPSPPPIPNTTKSKSPHLEQAVVDRLQSFRKKSQPEITSLVSNINEATLLPFRDDVSSSNSGSDLIGQNNGGVVDGDYNASLPSGGESLTLDEASKFFPALMDQRPVGSPLVRGTGNSNYGNVLPESDSTIKYNLSTLPNVNIPLPNIGIPAIPAPINPPTGAMAPIGTAKPFGVAPTSIVASSIGGALHGAIQPTAIGFDPLLPLLGPSSIPLAQSISSLSLPDNPSQTRDLSLGSLIQPPMVSAQSSLPPPPLAHSMASLLLPQQLREEGPGGGSSMGFLEQNGEREEGEKEVVMEEDEEKDFTCFLCYREFDTPREIAEHCQKKRHLEIVRNDTRSSKLWRFFPPPPDQTQEDFKLCNKKSKCLGRLRCCKAHSPEELQEWSDRHKHRQTSTESLSPRNLISMSTTSSNYTHMKSLSVTIDPSHHTMMKIGSTVSWKLEIKGEAWQTLMGVVCIATPPVTTPLTISYIKGDTIYSIFPRSNKWIATSFEEGILLGTISLLVKATPTKSGFNEHRVKLYFGSIEHIDIGLKVLCQ